ncbi:MAG: hypothetical protein ACOY4C_08005, partial [Pseudomonadota bacterium]
DRRAGRADRGAGGGGVTGGTALAARAIGDVGRRDLASEWAGPAPAAPQTMLPMPRAIARRATPRKP